MSTLAVPVRYLVILGHSGTVEQPEASFRTLRLNVFFFLFKNFVIYKVFTSFLEQIK